jgi:hypothetical protein
MVYLETGSRADMAVLERVLIGAMPGPLNFQRWSVSDFGDPTRLNEIIARAGF